MVVEGSLQILILLLGELKVFVRCPCFVVASFLPLSFRELTSRSLSLFFVSTVILNRTVPGASSSVTNWTEKDGGQGGEREGRARDQRLDVLSFPLFCLVYLLLRSYFFYRNHILAASS